MANRFARYSWGVLAYNVGVILWGAYVRATGSGAGCGQHWPLCNGEIIPRAPQVETLIEFSHRLTSGLALVLVVGLAVWAFRRYPRSHLVRRGAACSVAFIVAEALVGAGLVLFQLVAQNASLARAWYMALHLVNTFLLLGALALTAWWASTEPALHLRARGPALTALAAGLLGTMLLGASGAIVALGDTLFPATSLVAGLRQDLDPTAHFLIRLRVYHPMIAIVVGVGLIVLAVHHGQRATSPEVRLVARLLAGSVLAQWVVGVVNLALLAPIPLQLVHLLLADLVWTALVLLSASVLARPAALRVKALQG